MKKLWNQYSYAITLILLSFTIAFVILLKHQSDDQYVKVTISEGDTLWTISEQFADQHSLSNKEFVSWVKKHNENIKDQIYPGEKIVIPVSKNDQANTTELASAPKE
ncbi:cell division suppressor protein YneA [Neobacillus cucumis]|jgi:cell division protein YceG involved in septum cleavage|uniref:cell division suppressor protein YneA n=1 Tax=Neobacillus cucumis TaxID=1740721 RepID=UPI001965DC22|nr:LysM peptidoglycan-binding domain-containing protein [Neobacillus cucumis]MBM7652150.1 cell division protein YceG involved in septum cleavage [Neobacillus cucumis]MED4228129.1 LysM peptidoglycan-binding domain-containing protein [Neobacillus cucumis]